MYDIYKQTRTLCVLQYEHLNNWNECFRYDSHDKVLFYKGRMQQLKTLPRSVWSVWAAQRVNGNPYAGGGG